MIQNIDMHVTLDNIPENISDRVTLSKPEIVVPIESEDAHVSVDVNKSWRPYSETRTLLDFLIRPIRSIKALFEIARYNIDVRYAPYSRERVKNQ